MIGKLSRQSPVPGRQLLPAFRSKVFSWRQPAFAKSFGGPAVASREGWLGTGNRGLATGFTFIEMVIVVVMLSILVAIAVPIYVNQVRMTKEGVLKNNLAVMRERLDQYRADRNKYPNSLQELVDGGYLKEIPEDPITGLNEWEEVYSDYDPNEPDAEPGIEDVRSRSTEIGSDGRPYSEW